MSFKDNENTNTANGKFFTIVVDHREFDSGFRAWSFFNALPAAEELAKDSASGFNAILVMTDKHYSGDDVTGFSLGAS